MPGGFKDLSDLWLACLEAGKPDHFHKVVGGLMAQAELLSLSLSSINVNDNDNVRRTGQFLRFAELGDPLPREFLVDQVMPAKHATIAFGAGGAAKSMAMLYAGLTMSGGLGTWFDFPVLKHGPVLYLDFELEPDEQHRRVRDLAAGFEIGIPDDLVYYSARGVKSDKAFSDALGFCDREKIVAVILDSVGLAMFGDMDHAHDVLQFFVDRIEPFMAVGTTPLLVDHEGKRRAGERHQDKSPIGSAFKAWTARSVLQFQLIEHNRENHTMDIRIRHTKTNFGAMVEPVGVRFKFEPNRVSTHTVELDAAALAEEDSVPARDRVLGALDADEDTIEGIVKTTGLANGTVRNELSKLKKEGKVEVVRTDKGRSVYALSLSSAPIDDNDNDNTDSPGPNELVTTHQSRQRRS
jgi:hypothetical protein